MYIKSVILDGFKSYAKRTEITHFDPEFNAITGLNGSGKSNILDGICFVLGITNLANVRATNMQELIFKAGQGGITKASVTVVFDNCNTAQSPPGYENFKEITITRIVATGGRNKYLINGCNATNSRVHDLFGSVQLNVNNPHFLIMQGRVTKVLSMRPAEILSMVEEAVGTKMYERKRQLAIDTIAKKDLKLQQINSMLNDDIIPTINKLKEERSSYLEFQKMNREFEHTKRVFCAFEYFKLKEKKIKISIKLDELTNEKNEYFKKCTEITYKIEEYNTKIQELQAESESKSGNEFLKLKEKVRELSERETQETLMFQNATDKLNQLNKQNEKSSNVVKNIDETIFKNQDKLIKIKQDLEKYKKEKEEIEQELELETQNLQSAKFGICDDKNDNGANPQTLTELIIASSNRITKLKSNLDSVQKKISQFNLILREKEQQLKKYINESNIEEGQFSKIENELSSMTNSLQKFNFDPEKFQQQKTEKSQLKSEINAVLKNIEDFEARNPSLVFSHTYMRQKNFQSKVHGLVSSLFDVVDDRFMIAIESAAGGKLFNVVIDTDETTKELIKSGSLKKRITFISLNRVNPKKIDQKIMKLASSLVGDNKCWLASELVTCDKNVRVAIDFVLGNTIICESSKEAKILAYDKRVGFRCVTLDGDVFESTGVLTGGSRPTQNSLLQKQKEFRSYKINLEELTEKDFEIENYLSKNNATYNSYTNLVKKIEEKRIELELIQSKLKTSDRFQLQENISEIKNLVAECLNEEGQYKKEIALETKTHNELEEKSKNEAAFRAETVKKLEQNIQKIKQKLDLVLKKIAESEPMIFDLENQNEELQQEKGKQINQLKSISASINDFSDKIQEYETRMNKTKGELARLEKELEIIKQQIAEHNHHIQSLNSKRSQLNKELFEIELKKKEIDSNISNLKQTIHQTSVHINETLTQNNWIESEEKNFNNPGSVYNFSNINYKELKDRLDWLENSVKKLQRVVNTRAMNMLSQAEEKFNDLLKKKKIVENDRNKIENMIKDLDIKKNESLKISSRKVNSDFGSIFSTLLPGANAKLCLIENKNKLEGLEIKVGFGNSWKESLSELSGGQRSLVALSLILSLLLFKPAPIYILDEIDAALDISHTQNIGVMLRSHFRQSQFIIVSLKDGLFSNANVLFKTKFINGISNISRHVQDHRKQKENIPPEFINAGSN